MGVKWFTIILVLFTSGSNVECLNPELVREGPCNIPHPTQNIDFHWLESVPRYYYTAGSKYLLYRIAAGNPDFPNMNEYNFYYDFCCSGTINSTTGILHGTAFGTSVGTYTVTSPQPGVFNYVPQPPIPGAGQTLQGVITLTDNKSFVFLYKCFLENNQRGWDVFTTSPSVMTLELEERIKRHAESLGFDRKFFAFLRYGECQTRPEYGSGGGSGGSGGGHGGYSYRTET